MEPRTIISVSGGKDSTAMYLLACEQVRDGFLQGFEPIFADTGNELEQTLDYLRGLPEAVRGAGLPAPEIRWVRADFTRQIATRRANLERVWGAAGIDPERIARVKALLEPTGNPFLDLCRLKGVFPSTRRRFCTQELKHLPIHVQVVAPYLDADIPVIHWQGVRADESPSRAKLDPIEEEMPDLWIYRPLLDWTAEDVFAFHRKYGIEPNPAYKQGMKRVGCAPCIHAGKAELLALAQRFPGEIKRIAEWERLVKEVSKRGDATFFAADKTPDEGWCGIEEVVKWAGTERGGRKLSLLPFFEDATSCSSVYGLCE